MPSMLCCITWARAVAKADAVPSALVGGDAAEPKGLAKGFKAV